MKRADIIYGYLCLCLCTLQMFCVTQWSGCITYCCSGFGIFWLMMVVLCLYGGVASGGFGVIILG